MKKFALIGLIISKVLCSFCFAQPCNDLECDRAVIKTILTENNLPNGEADVNAVSWSYNGRITTVSFAGKNIQTLTPEIGKLSGLLNLYFNNNLRITSFQPEILQCTKLKTLNCQNCAINSSFPDLSQLPDLIDVRMFRNQFTSSSVNIGNLKQLKILYIQENKLNSLPTGIDGCTALEHLLFEYNPMTDYTLPSTIQNLTNLKTFSGYNCGLKGAMPDLSKMAHLNTISLQNNKMSSCTEFASSQTELAYISFGNNQVTALPASIGNLVNLKILYIYQNQIPRIPPEIGKCTNIEEFLFYINPITISLPREFANLRNLRTLQGGQCNIPGDMPDLSSMPNLVYVELHRNQLKMCSQFNQNQTKLQHLSIYSNQLPLIPSSISNLTGLKNLYISENLLTNLPDALTGLTSVTSLLVNNNKLCCITENSPLDLWLDQKQSSWRTSQSCPNGCSSLSIPSRVYNAKIIGIDYLDDGCVGIRLLGTESVWATDRTGTQVSQGGFVIRPTDPNKQRKLALLNLYYLSGTRISIEGTGTYPKYAWWEDIAQFFPGDSRVMNNNIE